MGSLGTYEHRLNNGQTSLKTDQKIKNKKKERIENMGKSIAKDQRTPFK